MTSVPIHSSASQADVVISPSPVEPPSWFGRLCWSSVLAGVVAAMAVQTVLTLLGVALGLSWSHAAALNDTAPAIEPVAISAGVWWIVSGAFSLALGGAAAAHYSGAVHHSRGAAHGFMVWSAMLVICGLFVGVGASSLVTGGLGVLANAAPTARAEGVRVSRNATSGNAAVPDAPGTDAGTPRWTNADGSLMNEAQRQEAVRQATRALAGAAWWSFASLVIGALAAIGGGMMCSVRTAGMPRTSILVR